jgi:hypothetical protein
MSHCTNIEQEMFKNGYKKLKEGELFKKGHKYYFLNENVPNCLTSLVCDEVHKRLNYGGNGFVAVSAMARRNITNSHKSSGRDNRNDLESLSPPRNLTPEELKIEELRAKRVDELKAKKREEFEAYKKDMRHKYGANKCISNTGALYRDSDNTIKVLEMPKEDTEYFGPNVKYAIADHGNHVYYRDCYPWGCKSNTSALTNVSGSAVGGRKTRRKKRRQSRRK